MFYYTNVGSKENTLSANTKTEPFHSKSKVNSYTNKKKLFAKGKYRLIKVLR